jgi:hypothetical protein
MEDQIVSFETAKLLREIIDFPYNIPNWYSQIGTLNYSHTAGDEFHLLKGLPAPTQTCLRRWLRENYDIHIVIDPSWDEEKTKTIYEWTTYSDLYDEDFEDFEYFDSYEEALELALQEGLNLVKSKNK